LQSQRRISSSQRKLTDLAQGEPTVVVTNVSSGRSVDSLPSVESSLGDDSKSHASSCKDPIDGDVAERRQFLRFLITLFSRRVVDRGDEDAATPRRSWFSRQREMLDAESVKCLDDSDDAEKNIDDAETGTTSQPERMDLRRRLVTMFSGRCQPMNESEGDNFDELVEEALKSDNNEDDYEDILKNGNHPERIDMRRRFVSMFSRRRQHMAAQHYDTIHEDGDEEELDELLPQEDIESTEETTKDESKTNDNQNDQSSSTPPQQQQTENRQFLRRILRMWFNRTSTTSQQTTSDSPNTVDAIQQRRNFIRLFDFVTMTGVRRRWIAGVRQCLNRSMLTLRLESNLPMGDGIRVF